MLGTAQVFKISVEIYAIRDRLGGRLDQFWPGIEAHDRD